MKHQRTLLFIGIIEIMIGGISLLTNFNVITLSTVIKPINVSCFVLVTAIISTILGIGILRLNKKAYDLLLYFSSVIVLSKVLLFMNIIQLNGALQTSIPSHIQDLISVLYHLGIIIFLKNKEIHALFHRNLPTPEPISLDKLRENRLTAIT